jgi:hypothetical protein
MHSTFSFDYADFFVFSLLPGPGLRPLLFIHTAVTHLLNSFLPYTHFAMTISFMISIYLRDPNQNCEPKFAGGGKMPAGGAPKLWGDFFLTAGVACIISIKPLHCDQSQ